MVEDDAGLVALPGSIRTVIDILLLSAAYAEETDDVVVARLNGVISEGDARRWGSLSEDGDVVTYLELRLQGDDASHIEDDDSLSRFDSLSERTCSAVIEIGYVYYFSTSSAGYISSVTFCARKGWSLCQRGCVISLWRTLFVFSPFSRYGTEKIVFIYNKAQTFTSSGFAFPQKICIFAENFFKYGKDTNKI